MFAVRALILATCLLAAADGADAPRFSDFPARQVFQGKPAAPEFRRGEDLYPNGPGHSRTGVTFAVERGPNFAGHYTLAPLSCGTSCGSIAVIDSITGRIYRNMPFGAVIDARSEPFSFRLDSRLLIVQGYFDVDVPDKQSDCWRRYYVWTGASFRLLRRVALRRAPQP